jgi:hypothetical protein
VGEFFVSLAQAEEQLEELKRRLSKAQEMLDETPDPESLRGDLAEAESDLYDARVAVELGEAANVTSAELAVAALRQQIEEAPRRREAIQKRIQSTEAEIKRGKFAVARARTEAGKEAEQRLRERALASLRTAFEHQAEWLMLARWMDLPVTGKPARHGINDNGTDILTAMAAEFRLTPELTLSLSVPQPTTQQVEHLLSETKEQDQ